MPFNFINLSPVVILAIGAIVSIVLEPLLKNTSKHRFIPWVSASFIVLAAVPYLFAVQADIHSLFTMNPLQRLLAYGVLLSAFVGIGGIQFTLAKEQSRGGEAYGLLLLATTGVLLMLHSMDYLALFIGMELASFPIYALVAYRRKSQEGNEAVFKYFLSGAVFSVVFLYGVSLIYGATGSTHFASVVLEGRENLYISGFLLVLFGLLFKAGAAPVHYWVADVYTGAPVSVTAFMAAVVKVGALAALSSVWLTIPSTMLLKHTQSLEIIILSVAFISIIIGALSGLAQKSIRRILAFSAVMNAGFMVLGLLLPNFSNHLVHLGPMYFFLLTYAIASVGALTGISYFSGENDEKENLDSIRGMGRTNPLVGMSVIVCLASLAGIPPVAGFMAKFVLFSGLFSAQYHAVAITGFLLSIVAAVYYIRIAYVLFASGQQPKETLKHNTPDSRSYLLKLGVLLTALSLLILSVIPKIGLIV